MQRAFTLIELLVVITIIVVLLALLTPALDKAVYQAQLAVCGSRQKGVVGAATLYAFDNKRLYPARDPNYAWDSIIIRHPNNPTASPYPSQEGGTTNTRPGGFDLRPLFKPYMSLEQFIDPLCMQGLSLEPEDNQDQRGATGSGTRGEVTIYSSFHINTGWKPFQNPANKALNRLGDRWTSRETMDQPKPIDRSFAVLVSDVDNSQGSIWAQSSHPDPYYDSMKLLQFQAREGTPDTYSPAMGAKFAVTWGVWIRENGYPQDKEKSDYNYAYTDGSVVRYSGVKYYDDRMAKVIVTDQTQYNQRRYWQLPKAGN